MLFVKIVSYTLLEFFSKDLALAKLKKVKAMKNPDSQSRENM